jgi:hypothetical protein
VLVPVEVLEETLDIESLPHELLFESVDHLLGHVSLHLCGVGSAVDCLDSGVIEHHVNSFFKAFLGEDFIDEVAEVPPLDMLALLRSLEMVDELLELVARENNLSHVEANPELGLGDEARPEFVKIPEELANSDSLLFARLSDSGNHIVNVVGLVLHNVHLHFPGLSSWEILE